MGKRAAGAELPEKLHDRFVKAAAGHPKGKSGVIVEALDSFLPKEDGAAD